MEYNKNQFAKTNDKKVLHKVKKQWVVLSLALLAAIGGGAVATKTSAHAATNNGNGIKANLNNKLAQSSSSQKLSSSKVTNASSVSTQANALHNRIMQGANNSQSANANNSVHNYVGGVNHQFSNANENQVGNANNNVKANVNSNVKTQNGLHSYVNGLNNAFRQNDAVQANRNANVGNQASVKSGATENYNGPQVKDSASYSIPVTVMYIDKEANNNYRVQTANGSTTTSISDVTVSGSDGDKVGFTKGLASHYNYIKGDNVTGTNGNQAYTQSAQIGANGAKWIQPNDGSYTPIHFNAQNISNSDMNDIQSNKMAWDVDNNQPIVLEEATDAKNITVHYINQSGVDISNSTNDTISGQGRDGDEIDVTNSADGGYSLPDSSDYEIVDNNVAKNYQFNSDRDQDIVIPVQGKTKVPNDSNNQLTIHFAGNKGLSVPNKTISVNNASNNAKYGDEITIDPSQYNPSGYHVAPNQTNVTFYLKDNDGHTQLEQVNPSTGAMTPTKDVTFNYQAGANIGTAKPITVQYIDQDNNLVKSDTINFGANASKQSVYGHSINVISGSKFGSGRNAININGVSVPNNYTLDANQSDVANHMISSDNSQVVKLYVMGNDITTNSTTGYGLHIKEGVEDYTNNGNLNSGNNSNGYHNGTNSDVASDAPTINAKVGDTFVINPGDYIPSNIDKNAIVPASDNGSAVESNDALLVHVTGNGLKISNVPHTAKSLSNINNGNATDNMTIPFMFKNYGEPQAKSKIYVHYVSYDPLTNSYSSDIPNTEVSDSGVNGKNFNDTPYKENVPRGYQLFGVKSFNDEAIDSRNNPVEYGSQKGDKTGNLVIAVIPNVGQTTVYFRNQNGDYVTQSGKIIRQSDTNDRSKAAVTLPGTEANQTSPYGVKFNSRFGQKVDLTKDNAEHCQLPAGYQINATWETNSSNKPENYIFNNKFYPTTYTVSIDGNQTNPNSLKDEVNVKVNEENPDGAVTNSYNVVDHLAGKVGDDYTVSADSYKPNGYNIISDSKLPADIQNSYKGQILNSGASLKNATFDYISTAPTTGLQPINIIFMDQGKEVGTNTINPSSVSPKAYAGDTINVATQSGFSVPQGYDLVNGQNTNATFSTKAQSPLTLNVYNPANEVSGTVEVHRYMQTMDGQSVFSDQVPVVETGEKGQRTGFTITPGDVEPKGYNIAPADSNITGVFTNDGIKITSNNEQDSNGNPSETYVGVKSSNNNPSDKPSNSDTPGNGPHTGKAEPIWVHFYDDSGSNWLTNNVAINGDIGQKFNDIAKTATQILDNDGNHIMDNYHVVGNQQLNDQITDEVQQKVIHVRQNNSKDRQYYVKLHLERPNAHTDYDVLTRGPITISNNSDETVNPSDYLSDSNDFQIDPTKTNGYNVSDNNGILKINGNQVSNNSSINFYYQDRTSSADKNLQPIIVNFINQNDVLLKGSGQEITGKYANEPVNLFSGDSSQGVNGVSMPKGYRLPQGRSENQYNYNITDAPQTIDVNVEGNKSNTINYEVMAHYIDSDGNSTVTPVNINQNNITFQVGSTTEINPHSDIGNNNGTLDPGQEGMGYTVIPGDNNDNPFGVYENSDGVLTPASGSKEVDYYLPSTNNTNITMIHFINQNGQEVGTPQLAYGLPQGQKINNIMNYTTKSGKTINLETPKYLPKGYNLVNRNSNPYTVPNRNLSSTYVKVIGRKVNPLVSIKRIGIKSNGTMSDLGALNNKSLESLTGVKPMTYRIGNSVTLNASQVAKYGYRADNHYPSAITFAIGADKYGNATVTPTSGSFFYDQLTHDQMKSGTITVNYMNQNGQYVDGNGTTNADNNPYNEEINALSDAGQAVNIASSDTQGPVSPEGHTYKGHRVPLGYHLAPNQNTMRTFNGTNQNVTLIVYGNQIQQQLTVHRNLANSESSGNSNSALSDVPVTIYGRVGDTITIGPKSYKENGGNHRTDTFQKSGTILVPSDAKDNNQSITIKPNTTSSYNRAIGNVGNNSGIIAPNNLTFDYKTATRPSGPLYVHYINQRNQQVGTVDVMRGNTGQRVNIADPTYGGEATPAGYQPTKDNTWYNLPSGEQSVYLRVVGNKVDHPVRIYRVLHHSNGITTVDTNDVSTPQNLNGENGNSDMIYANQYDPTNFTPDPSEPDSANIQLNADGTATPNRVVFYYNSTIHQSAPLNIRFIDKDTGKQVDNTIVENGNVGDSVNVMNKIGAVNGSTTAQENSPLARIQNEGYNLDQKADASIEPTNAHLSSQEQDINIPVIGNQVSANFKIYRIEKNLDGTTNIDNSDAIKNGGITIHGRVGSDININPYAAGGNPIVPNGYHSANTNSSFHVHINANGTISPINQIDYIYNQNYTTPNVGTIRIHYITDATVGSVDANGDPKDGSQVDQESDHGEQGTHFSNTDYLDDIPENMSSHGNNYDLVDTTTPSNNIVQGKNISTFNNGVQDVYIRVKNNTNNNTIIL